MATAKPKLTVLCRTKDKVTLKFLHYHGTDKEEALRVAKRWCKHSCLKDELTDFIVRKFRNYAELYN